jgi:hypothetical protein
MNIPILIAALIMTVAVIGHVAVGTKETATLEPVGKTDKQMAHWVQAMCAFQMLTPDLIIVTVLLYLLALTQLIPEPQLFALGFAGYFALQGVMWLGQILWLRRSGVTALSLPHWMVWLLCSVLMVLGA